MYTRLLFVLSLAAMARCQVPPAAVEQPKAKEPEPDINTIPGVAGTDYPNYHDIPQTSFACTGKIAGYYADTEARCQVWHYCSQEGLLESFLCPNGTIYSQERRVCEWYYDVDCSRTSKYIDVNKDLYIIPETTKAPPKTTQQEPLQAQPSTYQQFSASFKPIQRRRFA